MTGLIASSQANSRARLGGRAAELRSAFDRSFALPLRVDIAVKQDLLAIRIGAEPCAIRLSEVSGLFADRGITPVPASNAALLGIAGFRGAVVPVYSLRSLLGQSGAQSHRWLVIAAAMPVALAFDAFEGHLRVPADAIVPQHAAMRGCAREFVRAADAVRAVLHLPSVIAALGADGHPNDTPHQDQTQEE